MSSYVHALETFRAAKRRLLEERSKASREDVERVEGSFALLAREEAAFDQAASENADNVVAHRAKRFLQDPTVSEQVRQLLSSHCFSRGLTRIDMDEIWQKLLGNPRPIVIAPEVEDEEDEDFEPTIEETVALADILEGFDD